MASHAGHRWAKHALERLHSAGFRLGGARSAVFELLDREHCALTAHEIEERLRADGRAVARASVYRALEQLADLRLVGRLDVGHGMARYERLEPSGDHHHHMVCDSCGTVVPFEDPELERTMEQLSRRVSFAVDEHEVVLHGACGDCRA
ncbi:ferric iron uptake transcriptional regulator [soil metagenome]